MSLYHTQSGAHRNDLHIPAPNAPASRTHALLTRQEHSSEGACVCVYVCVYVYVCMRAVTVRFLY